MDILVYLGGFLVFLIMGGFGYLVAIENPKRDRERAQKEEEERIRKDQEYQKEQEQWEIKKYLPGLFSVEISDDVEENNRAYNEIVRLVNLAAVRTAIACVKQDKENRGVDEDIDEFVDEDVADLKEDWAKMRNNALKINPNLKDRLPHFSEFEPLKSYNEDHLMKKRAKRKRIS